MLQNRQITFGSGHQSRSTRLLHQRSSYVRVVPAGAAPTVAAPAGAAAASSSRGVPDSFAAVQQMIAARGLDPDPDLVSQEAHLAFTYLSSQQQQQQQGILPPRVQDAAQLADHALVLTDLMATGSTFRTLQMLKRHPGLLQLQPSEVGMRLIGWAVKVRQPGSFLVGRHLLLAEAGWRYTRGSQKDQGVRLPLTWALSGRTDMVCCPVLALIKAGAQTVRTGCHVHRLLLNHRLETEQTPHLPGCQYILHLSTTSSTNGCLLPACVLVLSAGCAASATAEVADANS